MARSKKITQKSETARGVLEPEGASEPALEAKGLDGDEAGDEELELSDPQIEEIEDQDLGDLERSLEAVAQLVDEGEGSLADEREGERANLAPTQRSLALHNPLQAYLNEARRYPLLSREAEHELAVRYFEDGDLAAARTLVTSNLRLVIKIAHDYRKAYKNLLDLVQEGNVGLMHAVRKFDPYRGVKLSSYAAWWIRAYILKFILNNWRLVKIGTTQNQRRLFYNLRREIEALERMGIQNPGPKLLAERLDVSEQEVSSMQKRLAGGDVSLDAPLRGDDDRNTTRLDIMPGATAGPERQAQDKEFSALIREKVATFGATLQGREKEIFELRTVADEPLTLQEIGDRYGFTRERARQLERRMMDRLRDYLREELGDAVEVALGGDE